MLKLKTFLLFFAITILSTNVHAAVPLSFSIQPGNNNGGKKPLDLRIAQMKYYSSLSMKDYEKIEGKKLNLIERLTFKASWHRMKKMLKAYDDGYVTTLEKISWLLKGLLFGPLAVIAGYIFLKDDERELIKWAWFGFIGFAAIIAIVLFTL